MKNLERDYYAPDTTPHPLRWGHYVGFALMAALTWLLFGGDVVAAIPAEMRTGLLFGALVGVPVLVVLVLYWRLLRDKG